MSTAKKAEPSAATAIRLNEQKWSKPLMDAGFTVVPSIIIERQRALGLDAIDMAIIMHLATHWWFPENKPRPSKRSLAAALNIHPRTVQKHIARLEKAQLIRREQRRHGGGKENYYHFDGLISAALPFAKEKLAERKARAEEAKKRAARRGKPVLFIANDDE